MATHMNHSGHGSNSGEDEVATPYNRPAPQFTVARSAPAPVDPTAGLLAEGGFLTLNDRDRAGLLRWFEESHKNISRPMRDRINKLFDKTFELLRVYDEELVQLRAENTTLRADVAKQQIEWVNSRNREFTSEVRKLRDEAAEMRRDVQKDCALQTETVVDMMIDRVRRELAGEILKIQNEVTEVRRGIDVTKIVADAAGITEQSFEGLRRELAMEIAKSREEVRRETRRAAAATKPAPAAPQPKAPKPAPAAAPKKGKK
jgi:hypothetical protein